MKILKRNGNYDEIKFDEITQKIKLLSSTDIWGNKLDIDPILIAKEVITTIYDGISTSELDEFTASISASMSLKNSDYEILAGRLIVHNHIKNTHLNYTDVVNKIKHLISDEILSLCNTYTNEINSIIQPERDYLISYFGFSTLKKSYLLKSNDIVVERPQHLYLRVSLGIHGNNFDKVKETYDALSLNYFTHATPTLFNAGTKFPQMSSCFLIGTEDTVDGIFKTISDVAKISKWAGGIGCHISNIRASGSIINKTNGKSQGIMPMLKIYNDVARYINQAGKRNGSFAMYIEPWHADIFVFLEAKKNNGAEEIRARDLFYALWIPDIFMQRVKDKGKWSLMCPNECPGLTETYSTEFEELYVKYENQHKYKKQIDAIELWNAIINCQIETGTPYMCYKDSANKKSNQNNIGIIKSSNLCVAPETLILTDNGYHKIKDLQNTEVYVWNGREFSKTIIIKTSNNSELIKVKLSNYFEIECTKYHKFYIKENNEIKKIEAKDLKSNMKLINTNFPIINTKYKLEDAYTHGYLMSELSGKITNECSIIIHTNKNEYIDNLNYSSMYQNKNKQMCLKFKNFNSIIPINYSYDSKLQFMKGYINSRGYIYDDCIRIMCSNLDILKDLRYLLQTCGVNCKIFKPMSYSLIIHDIKFAKKIDIEIHNNINNNLDVYIDSIKYTKRHDETYCFNEEIRHLGIFNGIITGQCTEIMEVSNSEETAVCNLASICLPKFLEYKNINNIIIYSKSNCKYCTLSKTLINNLNYKYQEIILDDDEERLTFYEENCDYENDIVVNSMPQIFINDIRIGGYKELQDYLKPIFNFEKLGDITQTIVENLNIIIDKNHYPTNEGKLSNFKHRPIGIGIQGLADLFMMLKLPFTSNESRKLNKDIFETIYYYSLKKSNELATKDGSYETFKGSHASNGILQFDLWNKTPEYYSLELWNELKQNIINNGLRNSLLVAPMPTASTAQIMGNNESFEPYTSNIYTRRVLAGEFVLINKHLVKTLKEYDMWNTDIINNIIYSKGSIQQLNLPTNIKEIYKTAWEISQKSILEMSADRGAYICQSQSLNIFISDADPKKINSVHMYGHSLGLKTGSYYIRTKSILKSQNFSMEHSIEQNLKNTKLDDNEGEGCLTCSS